MTRHQKLLTFPIWWRFMTPQKMLSVDESQNNNKSPKIFEKCTTTTKKASVWRNPQSTGLTFFCILNMIIIIIIVVAGMRIVTSPSWYIKWNVATRTTSNQKDTNALKMYSQVVFCFVFLFALFGQMSASSIPMWEYLTKDEKVSNLQTTKCIVFNTHLHNLQMAYLYSMFKNQVEEYCEFSEMDNCVDELTRFGLKRLREMSEIHLDEMDPYQRGASSMSEYFYFSLEKEQSLRVSIKFNAEKVERVRCMFMCSGC